MIEAGWPYIKRIEGSRVLVLGGGNRCPVDAAFLPENREQTEPLTGTLFPPSCTSRYSEWPKVADHMIKAQKHGISPTVLAFHKTLEDRRWLLWLQGPISR